jgi:hypothetical protein
LSCPDLLLLSQLADGALKDDEARSLAAHAAACEPCNRWLERTRHMREALSEAAAPGRWLHGALRTDACPSTSAVAGLHDPEVPSAEREAVANHLEACDACLAEALGATRLMARLDATPPLPVPAALRARVAQSWPAPAATKTRLSELVVRVTQAGAKLIESHLLAPLRELVEMPMPVPAMRRAATAEALCFRLTAPAATITATVVPAGEAVALTLLIEDYTGGPLAGQRVFLRHHGRSIYSARTDATGSIGLPNLERGVYEVSCPGIGTSFRLDLRA